MSLCVISHSCLIGMLEGLNKLTLVKGLVQCLALPKFSISIRNYDEGEIVIVKS